MDLDNSAWDVRSRRSSKGTPSDFFADGPALSAIMSPARPAEGGPSLRIGGKPMSRPLVVLAAAVVLAVAISGPVAAQEAGHIKVARAAVQIERSGQTMPAVVGAPVQAGDVVTTGADGAVGITFLDNSLLSAGPNSVLAIDRFAFDSTTHQGSFESSLRKGTLAVVSGKLAKQSPEAMKVKTPAAVLGVRGTEFLVRTGDPKD
jgi:hypothetical protein